MAHIIDIESSTLLRKIKAEDPKLSILGLFEVLAVYDKVFHPELHWITKGGLGTFELKELTSAEKKAADALLESGGIERVKGACFYEHITARRIIPSPPAMSA